MDSRKVVYTFVIVLLFAGCALWIIFSPWGGDPVISDPVILDFAAESSRALVIADTPKFVFGATRGKAHYKEVDLRYHSSTSGWHSMRDEERNIDYALLLGGKGAFTMNIMKPCPVSLELKGGAIETGEAGEADLLVKVNGSPVKTVRLPRAKEIHTIRIEVAEELLRAGENIFDLEVDGGISNKPPGFLFPVILSAFFHSAELIGVSGPTSECMPVPGKGQLTGLDLIQPTGVMIRFFHLPKKGDRLKANLSSKGGSFKGEVVLLADDKEPHTLFSKLISFGKPVELDLDLSPFADTPCSITFVSGEPGDEIDGSYLRWSEPYITGSVDQDLDREKPEISLSSKKPNIVIVLLDAASPFFFGSYNSNIQAAPYSDMLAEDSVVFETAVTPAPYTLPAVGSIMTGLLPDRHGVVWNANRDGVNMKLSRYTATLAGALKESGYSTLAVLTNPNTSKVYGYGEGFDEYVELFNDPELWDEGVDPFAADKKAIELINELVKKKEQPFFMYLHLFQPHAPYTPPNEFVSRYTAPYEGFVDGTREAIDGFKDTGTPAFDEKDFAHLKNLYAANLAWADKAANHFIEYLKSCGLYSDALIVLCSDHGESFGEHRTIEHGHHLYEEAIRVPLIIKFPKSAYAGKRVKDVVTLMDIAPTLVAHGKAQTIGSLGADGKDLTELLNGEASWPDRFHLARSDLFKPSYSLRYKGWQYIFDTWNRQEELYYIPDDTRQNHNLVEVNRNVAGFLRTCLCRALCRLLSKEAGEALNLDEQFIKSIEGIGYVGSRGTGISKPEKRCPLINY